MKEGTVLNKYSIQIDIYISKSSNTDTCFQSNKNEACTKIRVFYHFYSSLLFHCVTQKLI